MRPFRATLGVLVASAVSSCGLSSPLSRDEAATIVRTSELFTRPYAVLIPSRVYVNSDWSYGEAPEGPLSVSDLARVDPTLAILKSRGLVDIAEMTTPGQYRGGNHLLTIVPSHIDPALLSPDAGEDDADARTYRGIAVSTRDQRGIDRTRGWRMPVGTRVFTKVQEIHNWRDVNIDLPVNELAVDFTWRWQPSEAGDPFDSESDAFQSLPDTVQEMARTGAVRMNTGVPQLSRAFLQRIGNRWVLREIAWNFGRGNPL